LSKNINEVVKLTKHIVKKTHQLTDLALKGLGIVNWSMIKLTPILEKTN